MKRYDLDLCDGESGLCRADLALAENGDWVLYDEAATEIAELRAEKGG